MNRIVGSVLQTVGLVGVSVGAWWLRPEAGLITAGVSAAVIGIALERR